MKWQMATLGTVSRIVSGSTPKSGNAEFWGGEILWATPTDLSGIETKELSTTYRQITKAGLASCSANMLPARSVLFSSRAPIGLVAINTKPLCTNQGFKSFVPDTSILFPDFLYWWLKCNRPSLEHLGRGATFKEVSKSIIEKVQIPLPPLEEQKRIAGILDAADRLRTKRRESLAQLDTFLQSTFLELFGDPVTNPKGWEVRVIGSLVTKCSTWNPKKSNTRYFDYIDLSSVNKESKSIDGVERYLSERAPSRARQLVKSGDVLVATVRPNLNGVAVVKKQHDGMTASTGYCVLRPDTRRLEPSFLFEWVKTDAFVKKMVDVATGANYPAVSDAKVKASTIPLPPLDLQKHFAAIVASVEQQKARQRAHLADLDALFASLQSRGFNGEL